MRYWYCIDNNGNKWLYEGSVAPVKYDDEWNTSDEETDDSTWIGEFDLRATYGVGFVESLPDIANGEMTEIRIKYTAEKCEQELHLIYTEYFPQLKNVIYFSSVEISCR